jgi:uncharacterized repeat protein (TIGR01451 family)
MQNDVELPRNRESILYDGGDRILANNPIAMTRAAYPGRSPTTKLAGAVEMVELKDWGTEYVAPVGENVATDTGAFEYVVFYLQAAQDDTTVELPDGSLEILQMGESLMVRLNQNDKVRSDKPVQADLLTGDVDDFFELRWFSMLPSDLWDSDYLSPVGDSTSQTIVYCYNPHSEPLDVTYKYIEGGTEETAVLTLPAKGGAPTKTIPTGSAVRLTADKDFLPLSMTDTVMKEENGVEFVGQVYDWGFPLTPVKQLSSQAIVGMGFGCTDNECGDFGIKSVIWVAPTEDATIHVDYNNDGVVDKTYNVNKLHGQIVTDVDDGDMSGALIFATKQGTDAMGPPVSIATAWGQNPDAVVINTYYEGRQNQKKSLDMGTLVPGLKVLRASKQAELLIDDDGDGQVGPGNMVRYTIRIVNVGQTDLGEGVMIITDSLDDQVTYVAGTTVYYLEDQSKHDVPDDSNDSFPLAGEGIKNLASIGKRGGTHLITFLVTVKEEVFSDEIVNKGVVSTEFQRDMSFEVTVPLVIPTKPPTLSPTPEPTPLAPTSTPTNDDPTLPPVAEPNYGPVPHETCEQTYGNLYKTLYLQTRSSKVDHFMTEDFPILYFEKYGEKHDKKNEQ